MGEPAHCDLKQNIYDAIDSHADNVPASALRSIESLTIYLVKPAKNDTEKVRAIYRWLTRNIEYDTHEYFSSQRKRLYADPAENTFRTRKSVCEGYARLFKRMCDIAGLKAEIVSGWAKGFYYQQDGIMPYQSNHAWNAVLLNGRWHFIDSTWGAGHINGETKRFVREFDDHWFLTTPQQLIFTHYPEEQKWQLLDQVISLKEWKSLANFNSNYFKYGFDPEENKTAWIKASSSMVIKFNVPLNVVVASSLSILKGHELDKNYTLQQRRGNIIYVMISFPEKGTYELKLYAKYREHEEIYKQITSYKIEVEQGNNYQALVKTYNHYDMAEVEILDKSPIYANLNSGYRY